MTLETLWIFTKKCNAKPCSFLVIDTTLESDNTLHFRQNLLEKLLKLTMILNDKIREEKLQYDNYRKVAKISALSSGKIDEYKYVKYVQTKNYYLPIKEE